MRQFNNILVVFVFVAVVALSTGCSPSQGNEPGHEYMPDMAHSIAYEANTNNFYKHNTFSDEEEYLKFLGPRKPAQGTIPRGYAGVGSVSDNGNFVAGAAGDDWIPANGYKPYYYENTDEGRALATAQITENPFPITEKGLAQGKELYTTFCAICHGDKGDGNGYIVANEAYPAVPPNYLTEEFYNANDGRYYHAIEYGKGVMGSYKDKISYEERWQVIHYIRALQAKEQGKEYKPFAKTAEFDVAKAETAFGDAANYGKILKEALVLNKVLFNTGSAELQETSKGQLDEVVRLLKEYNTVKIRVNGHTDNVGDVESNQTLSKERAKSVFDYMVSNGIPAFRLQYEGYGDKNPTASNGSDEGRKRNRRTDFNIIGG